MRVVSLFSGGGLGDFGFVMAGHEIVAQVEIDPYCQKILALRYPDAKKFTDIKAVKGSDLPECDIITGGFPCQPFSVAGKQKGKDDNRYLWPEMLRVIKECRPRWVVGENVPGIINLALDTVCADLEAEGYEVWPIVFPSHALGAWHKRDRLWIVGHSRLFGQKEHEKQTTGTEQPSENVANTESGIRSKPETRNGREMFARRSTESIFRDFWSTEPTVGRRLNGYPDWLDFHIVKEMSYATQIRYNKKLRELWKPATSQALWKAVGGFNRIQKAEILFALMCEYEKNTNKARILLESEEALKDFVRELWVSEKITSTSSQSGNKEQRSNKHPDAMQELSRFLAHNLQENWQISCWEDGIDRVANGVANRVDRLKMLGNGQTPCSTFLIGTIIKEIEDEPIANPHRSNLRGAG